MIFVVAYDRNTSERLTFETFLDSDRLDAELLYRTLLSKAMAGGPVSVEVNMFESVDETTFRFTHARYFQTPHEALQALRQSLVA